MEYEVETKIDPHRKSDFVRSASSPEVSRIDDTREIFQDFTLDVSFVYRASFVIFIMVSGICLHLFSGIFLIEDSVWQRVKKFDLECISFCDLSKA